MIASLTQNKCWNFPKIYTMRSLDILLYELEILLLLSYILKHGRRHVHYLACVIHLTAILHILIFKTIYKLMSLEN